MPPFWRSPPARAAGGKIAGDAALIGKNDEGRLLDRTAEDGFAVLLDDTQRERLIVETVTRDVADERALTAFVRYIINLKPLCRGKILGRRPAPARA